MTVRRIAATGLALVVLAGCGPRSQTTAAALTSPATTSAGAESHTPPTSHPTTATESPLAPDRSTGAFACTGDNTTALGDPEPNDGPRLPADFVPVAAYVCFEQQRSYPHDGIWAVTVEQRLTGDLAPVRHDLLEADTPTPSATPGVTFACPAMLVVRPTLSLVSTRGQVIRPRAPVDFCNDQLPALDEDVARLHHVTVSVIRERQLETQATVDADARAQALGCSPAWKDDFSHGMVPRTLSPGGPLQHVPTTLSLCRFASTRDDPQTATFVAGRRLDAAQTRRLLAALTRPGKPGGCSKPHRGVLVAQGKYVIAAEIELGGCSRVIRDPNGYQASVGRADPKVVAAVLPGP